MIQIENLTKFHRQGEVDVPALRGLSGDIAEGELTFVVGPSGSGKSTLLYLLGALDDPTEGEIRVDGRSLSQLSDRQRDQYRREEVGFVFQSFNLLSNLSALENVLVPYLPTGIPPDLRRRAADLLRRVGLESRLEHRPAQLSGGEQQRVAIARALLKRPQIVLADEPTGELDTRNGAEVFRHLRELHREHGSTIVVATHDGQYIRDGDRLLTLQDGRLIDDRRPPSGRIPQRPETGVDVTGGS